jgi:hypothetical protein
LEFIDRYHEGNVFVAWPDPIDSSQKKLLRLSASTITVRDIYRDSNVVADGQDRLSDCLISEGAPYQIVRRLVCRYLRWLICTCYVKTAKEIQYPLNRCDHGFVPFMEEEM